MNLCSRCSGELPAFAVFCPHCAQVHEPNFDELIDLTIEGRYRIYRRLGQGGLSTIFAATDLETDSVVAIKISNPAQLVLRAMNYAMDADRARDYWDEMLERMRREAEALATIAHPNIVRFDGTGMINDDLRYVVMEFLRGPTLRDEIDHNGIFEQSKAVNVAIEVASALIEVHARDIVHRDINPRNIMIADSSIADCGLRIADSQSIESEDPDQATRIENQPAIKLIDFGIAKFPQPPGAPPFTQHSTIAGTVAYASPEQCASRLVDNRSDIYSLGVVVYEMVTGQRPFTGRTPTEVALKQIQSEPAPPRSINPAISISLERTILRALSKNPDERQQSAEAFSEELRLSSNQIFIPLVVTPLEAPDQFDESNGISPFAYRDEIGETDESNLRLVRRSRRRFAVAAATTLVAVITAALYGWSSNSSWRNAGAPVVNPVGAASPAPEAGPAAGSVADSLELAANAPSPNNNPNGASPLGAQATPSATQQTQAANPATPNNKAAAQTAIPPTPAPIPEGTRPQMPPAPPLDIALKRPTPPASVPDVSQGPIKERAAGGQRSRTESATGDSNQGGGDMDPDEDRVVDYNPPRRGANDAFNRRRIPSSPNQDRDDRNGDDDDDDDDSGSIRPRLYHWSGRVNYEREITIELPGAPGTIEIPRAYRNRVGMIEPPSANNGWRFVVLRVFGQGGVSIIVRWWPATRTGVKMTARRL
jgi:serine/threonine protein kinase